ncbi:MAG: hypothetical protein IKY07_03900, partial [Clostridia bacterium]|nr:hypothetical protein [Clostridia bacterium]
MNILREAIAKKRFAAQSPKAPYQFLPSASCEKSRKSVFPETADISGTLTTSSRKRQVSSYFFLRKSEDVQVYFERFAQEKQFASNLSKTPYSIFIHGELRKEPKIGVSR